MEGKDLIGEMEIREGYRDQDKDGDKKKTKIETNEGT